MRGVWASIIYVCNLLTGSPAGVDSVVDQFPTSHQILPNRLETANIAIPSDGPKFRPPESSDWADIDCKYPTMTEYRPCSTDGDRSCWLFHVKKDNPEHFNITTDYETRVPKGILRQYYLEVENGTWTNPDGTIREVMLVNGSYPGPWIQACWGDDIEITVKNKLPHNGTTMHWHGIRQLNSFAMDGVNAITQCPVAPEESFTYRFKTQQYGTAWYHSHYSLQYGEGVLGPMTIHGPSSADYDYAKYPVMMSDWSYISLFERWTNTIENEKNKNVPGYKPKPGRGLDAAVLNGTIIDGKNPGKGYTLRFEKGKRYLLRLINTSVESAFAFAIDNHKIQVIAADFVPIEPYYTDRIVVGIGQRYNIIVSANTIDGSEGGSYWIRMTAAWGCGRQELWNKTATTGIIHYEEAVSIPKDYPVTYKTNCTDEPFDKLVPMHKWKVGKPTNFAADSQFEIGGFTPSGAPFYPTDVAMFKWNMYTDTMWLDFANATINQLDTPKPPTPDQWDSHAVVIDKSYTKNDWVYLLLSGTGVKRGQVTFNAANHPIHLHGHDFAILEQSDKPYRIGGLNLKLDNPPRRDVAFLPSNGYLVLAFKADNPGAWLMHCHIAWHASEGLAVQILENRANITLSAEDKAQRDHTCKKWKEWKEKRQDIHQDDSGI